MIRRHMDSLIFGHDGYSAPSPEAVERFQSWWDTHHETGYCCILQPTSTNDPPANFTVYLPLDKMEPWFNAWNKSATLIFADYVIEVEHLPRSVVNLARIRLAFKKRLYRLLLKYREERLSNNRTALQREKGNSRSRKRGVRIFRSSHIYANRALRFYSAGLK